VCLITFAYQSHPRYNLLLVANRDEFYARETAAADYWKEDASIYAGRDLEQGGTWLGINKMGKFSAVTNYRDGRHKPQGKKSRGLLTLNYLQSNLNAEEYINKLQPKVDQYGGFNLLCIDASGLYYLSNSGGGSLQIKPGVYGLSNAHLDTPWPKVSLARDNLKKALSEDELTNACLMRTLHNTEQAHVDDLPDTGISQLWEKQLSSQFISIEGYGTRCTSVLMQQYNGKTTLFEQSFSAAGPQAQRIQEFQLPLFGSAQHKGL
jgi:uncharacterized protein with NRDE domain